jgi:hypothetical protein
MPDQSLSNDATSGKTGSETGNPADTSANHPEAASPASVAANVTEASEGQTQQADVTINQDPIVGSAEARQDDYDDEEKHPYRALQQLAKGRDLDASGKREEIVARLRANDAGQDTDGARVTPENSGSPAYGAVDPTNVENGGIQRTSVAVDHASVLQGLSNDRRAQQLAAVQGRASAASADED